MTTSNAASPISGIRIRIRPACVLIVDDESRIVDSLRALLSDEFVVTATTRPRDALASVTSGAWYDVILSDVMMPEMTGVELRERIRAVNPELSARIIFMTGGVPDARTRDQLEVLPNMVLEKPFDVGDLRELIRRRVQVERPRQRRSLGYG